MDTRQDGMDLTDWKSLWEQQEYIDRKEKVYEALISYLPPISSILDIGCGFAYETGRLQKKYGSHLYLMDGEGVGNREVGYGDVETMSFYNTIKDLKDSWNKRNLDYTFIDASTPVFPPSVDLVYSSLSYGFHYPLSTYADQMKKYTNSIILLDLRDSLREEQEEYIEFIEPVYRENKSALWRVKF